MSNLYFALFGEFKGDYYSDFVGDINDYFNGD